MKMRCRCAICAAVAAGTAFQSLAEVETVTSSAATFKFYGNPEQAYSLTSNEEIATWPVTWRAGETVVATAMDGTGTTLSGGAGATSAALPSQGGVWTLANSAQGVARVGIPWTVFNDGGTYGANASAAGFVADMAQTGPDRKLTRRETPPVAYSGDDWAGDLTKAATLTFTPPDGGEAQTPTLDPAGTGVKSFTFDKVGDWTVTLKFADGTTKTATVTIQKTGFMVFVR